MNSHDINLIEKEIKDSIFTRQKIFDFTKSNERMIYTLYHELAHLKEAIKLGFSLSYLRVDNRVFFIQKKHLFSGYIKNYNRLASGCLVVYKEYSDKNIKNRSEELSKVVLAGGKITESFLEKEKVSHQTKKRILKTYPVPYDPSNDAFYDRASKIGTDAWLYNHIANDQNVACKILNQYKNVSDYIENGEESKLENIGALKFETLNFKQIHFDSAKFQKFKERNE